MEEKTHNYGNSAIHFILAHSYLIFLFIIILGIIFDTFFQYKIFSNSIYQYVGFFMLLVSSVVVLWAQKVSVDYKTREKRDESMSPFEHGPYRYLRNPTHLSIFIMTFGFGLIINSFFSVLFSIVAYLITRFLFIKKEEEILEKKYGEVYTEYKKKVKNWI